MTARPAKEFAPDGSSVLGAWSLRKTFPGLVALDDIDFDVRAGEIHALVGENGAGKSTLIKVLTGSYAPDGGELRMDDRPIRLSGPRDARRRGISQVPQDVLFVPELSIGRNILLGLEGPASMRSHLTRREHRRVSEALARVGADFPPGVIAGTLSVPQLRLAQIARTVMEAGRVVIFDEPTAVLSEHDSDLFLQRVVAMRDEDRAVLYVSHRISEVMRIADRISVLRDGRKVAEFARGEATRQQVIDLMAKDVLQTADKGDSPAGDALSAVAPVRRDEAAGIDSEPLLVVRDLSAGDAFRGVSLEVSRGQIVGIAGVQGSGHGRLIQAIAGARPAMGEVRLAGRRLPDSLRRRVSAGLSLVPADRRGAGIIPEMSVRDNLVLSDRIDQRTRAYGMRWPGRELARSAAVIARFRVRASSPYAKVGTLSGGNQQKVVLARALESTPRVLLVEEPTQGIDIHAKREISRLLRATCREGRAVLIASSEFEELLGLADVIHVMRSGRLVATLDGRAASYQDILSHALS